MASTLWIEPWEESSDPDPAAPAADAPAGQPAETGSGSRRRARRPRLVAAGRGEPALPDTPTPVLGLPAPARYRGANRRFLPRVRRAFRVRLADGEQVVDGVDISFGGMMCMAEEAVWPGNLIEADLWLGDDRRALRVVGRVVELVNNRGELAMRVRFEQVSAADRRRIAMWMAG